MNPKPPTWMSAKDDELAEGTPVGRRVDDDEAGHADGRCRREQRGDEIRRLARLGRDRQQQQDGADRDEHREAARRGRRTAKAAAGRGGAAATR